VFGGQQDIYFVSSRRIRQFDGVESFIVERPPRPQGPID
jgi:hypothetical protein